MIGHVTNDVPKSWHIKDNIAYDMTWLRVSNEYWSVKILKKYG